jgi:hypothetical protein
MVPGNIFCMVHKDQNKPKNLTKIVKLDGLYLEKKKHRVSKWPLILQIFHIKRPLIKKTVRIYL